MIPSQRVYTLKLSEDKISLHVLYSISQRLEGIGDFLKYFAFSARFSAPKLTNLPEKQRAW